MVSDTNKKKGAAAAKRGESVSGGSTENESKVDSWANSVETLQISDRACTGVLCSHPLSRDIRTTNLNTASLRQGIHLPELCRVESVSEGISARNLQAVMAPSLLILNDERVVVLLYIIRILFSTSLSLAPQAFFLSSLTIFALYAEISADHALNHLAQFFKARPGASSGILLGAVTLPGLMLSRLIQILRVVSLKEVGIEEMEHMKLQFWAVSASCCSVIIFLCVLCRHQEKSSSYIWFHFKWHAKYGFICITTLGYFFVSLFGKFYGGGLPVALMSLWVLYHGLAAVKLIQKILLMFPACASIGESLLVTSGLVIYFGDMLMSTAAKMPVSSSKLVLLRYGIKRSEISIIVQGMILGLLLFPMFCKYALQMWECLCSSRGNGAMRNHEIKRSVVFYASLVLMLVVAVPSWMQFVHPFHVHPLLWAIHFVFSEPLQRLTLCVYWLVVIYASVRCFYNISKNSTLEVENIGGH